MVAVILLVESVDIEFPVYTLMLVVLLEQQLLSVLYAALMVYVDLDHRQLFEVLHFLFIEEPHYEEEKNDQQKSTYLYSQFFLVLRFDTFVLDQMPLF